MNRLIESTRYGSSRPMPVSLPACVHIACWLVILSVIAFWIGWAVREFNASEERRINRELLRQYNLKSKI